MPIQQSWMSWTPQKNSFARKTFVPFLNSTLCDSAYSQGKRHAVDMHPRQATVLRKCWDSSPAKIADALSCSQNFEHPDVLNLWSEKAISCFSLKHFMFSRHFEPGHQVHGTNGLSTRLPYHPIKVQNACRLHLETAFSESLMTACWSEN